MVKVLKGGEAATDRKGKLFVQIFGTEGTGKTSLALSFPSPLYIVNLDRNMDELLMKLPSHYEIHYEEIPYDVDMTRGIAAQTIMKVKGLFQMARNTSGTFILDGADLYWEHVKMARLPEGADVPNQWGPANTEMESLFRQCEAAQCHVAFVGIASNVWEGMQKETKKMKADGFKHAGRFINTKVYMFSPEDHNTPHERPVEAKGKTHSAFISTSKLNETIEGAVFPNPSFKLLYRSIFGQLPENHEQLWMPGKKAEEPSAKAS